MSLFSSGKKNDAFTVKDSENVNIATGNGQITNNYGVSDEKFQELSEELGVTKHAIKTFFRILGKKDIPQEDWTSELHEMAKRHQDLERQIQEIQGDDTDIQHLREQASQAIEDGQYEDAEKLLIEIRSRADEIAQRKEEEFHQYRITSAESSASLGAVKMNQYDFLGAAEEYAQAAKSVQLFDAQLQAVYLNDRGEALSRAGAFDEAIGCYRTYLLLCEKEYGADSNQAAGAYNNLAMQLEAKGEFVEAEQLYGRALEIRKAVYGPDHHEVAGTCNNLAWLLQAKGEFVEAEQLYRRALKIREAVYGPDHHEVAATCNNLALLLQTKGEFTEAEQLYRRSLDIQEAVYGPDHHEVGTTCNNLAVLLQAKGEFTEAEQLYRRALKIREAVYGPDHHEVGTTCNNLAMLLQDKGEFSEAEKLYRRALKIRKTVYGPDHHEVAMTIANISIFHAVQGDLAQAHPLMVRAHEIFQNRLGPDHPYTQKAEDLLERINKAIEDQGKPDE